MDGVSITGNAFEVIKNFMKDIKKHLRNKHKVGTRYITNHNAFNS